MKAIVRFAGLLVMVLIASANQGWSQGDKKATDSWKPSVEFTDKAPNWLLKEAKAGIKMLSDRDYLVTELPKEIVGGTYVMRDSGEYGTWLPDATLTAKKKSTVYALVRVKYLGKDTFDELAQKRFEKEGWKAVEGKVATTYPAGENWVWKAYKKGINEGPVILQLQNLVWERKTAVLFVVK